MILFHATSPVPGSPLVYDENLVFQDGQKFYAMHDRAPGDLDRPGYVRTRIPVAVCSDAVADYLRKIEDLYKRRAANHGEYVEGEEAILQQCPGDTQMDFDEIYEYLDQAADRCCACHTLVNDCAVENPAYLKRCAPGRTGAVFRLDVQPRNNVPWRCAMMCLKCVEAVDADMWISEECLERINCKTPFERLPILP